MQKHISTKFTWKNSIRFDHGLIGAALLVFVFMVPNYGQKEAIEAPRATSREGLVNTSYMTTPEVSDDIEGNNDEYCSRRDREN